MTRIAQRIAAKIKPILNALNEEALLNKVLAKIHRQAKADGIKYCQVLTVYKRKNLALQLKCILEQALAPQSLLIYHNQSYVDIRLSRQAIKSVDVLRYTHNVNWNAKFHGRFYACLPVDAKFYIVWDDDIEPGRYWNQRCLDLMKNRNCIVTANGRIILQDALQSEKLDDMYELGYGDGSFRDLDKDTVVDYGGHSWAFRRKSLIDMASYDPPSLLNSEDFHISAASLLASGTETVVPSQQLSQPDFLPDKSMSRHGVDRHASYNTNTQEYMRERRRIIQSWINDMKYVPLLARSGFGQ
ncbi:hypothetical protein [Synechococcus sp. GFB01]|uniref:hypothetical protein n=1 Tax=Synechococcus sp. GFB01 TaxID=1662190 RepID=UPI000A6750EC|nr:hypothetical protein [Synechococcus sp. GFB01]